MSHSRSHHRQTVPRRFLSCTSRVDQNEVEPDRPPGCYLRWIQTTGGSLQSLLREFDDFLCCPFRETELVARIRRLVEWDDNDGALARAHAIKEKFHLQSLVGDGDCFLRGDREDSSYCKIRCD